MSIFLKTGKIVTVYFCLWPASCTKSYLGKKEYKKIVRIF